MTPAMCVSVCVLRMVQSDTQDWYRSNISPNFRIELWKKNNYSLSIPTPKPKHSTLHDMLSQQGHVTSAMAVYGMLEERRRYQIDISRLSKLQYRYRT